MSELLAGEECARSANAGLHLVRHDQNVPGGALLEYGVHKCLLQCVHTALTLNVFQHHCTNGVVQLGFQIGNVIGCHIVEALHKREEIVVEYVLTGGGQGAEGSAVERIHQRQNLVSALAVLVEAVLSRQLNGTLVCLCTAVAEEHLFIAGSLTQLLCEVCLHLGVVQVGGVLHGLDLLADCLRPRLVAVAQRGCTDAAAEVDVLLSGFVSTGLPCTVIDHHRKPSVCSHDGLVHLFLCCHSYHFLYSAACSAENFCSKNSISSIALGQP